MLNLHIINVNFTEEISFQFAYKFYIYIYIYILLSVTILLSVLCDNFFQYILCYFLICLSYVKLTQNFEKHVKYLQNVKFVLS